MKSIIQIPIVAIILISVVLLAVLIGGSFLEQYICNTNAEKVLTIHQMHCDGECHLVSVSRAPYENTAYYYECDHCHEVFRFYNQSIPLKLIYNTTK